MGETEKPNTNTASKEEEFWEITDYIGNLPKNELQWFVPIVGFSIGILVALFNMAFPDLFSMPKTEFNGLYKALGAAAVAIDALVVTLATVNLKTRKANLLSKRKDLNLEIEEKVSNLEQTRSNSKLGAAIESVVALICIAFGLVSSANDNKLYFLFGTLFGTIGAIVSAIMACNSFTNIKTANNSINGMRLVKSKK